MNTFHDKINLNGIWDFTTEADGDIPKNFQSTMTVPGCFDVAADYLDYRGLCYYRKFIDIEEKINCCLKFEGVAHNAKIFFDRKMLAKHHGAFTGFEVDLGRVESGRHEVIAQVDNNLVSSQRWWSCRLYTPDC